MFSLAIAFAFTVLGMFLQTLLSAAVNRTQTRFSRLVELYGNLMAIASDNLERARDQDEMLTMRLPSDQAGWLEFGKEWEALDGARHGARRESQRLFLQLKLLEHDASLLRDIEALVNPTALFFHLRLFRANPNSMAQLEAFRAKISNYEHQAHSVASQVENAYSNWSWFDRCVRRYCRLAA